MNFPRFSMVAAASVVAALLGITMVAAAQAAMPVTGTWLSADGGTKVRVTDCGGKLCGKVVWLNEPIDQTTGKPKTDKHNSDAAKRARPLLGVQVVQGMKPSGDNKWSGQIYNADDGKTYQANVTLVSENAMRVQGCVLGLLCKSQTWTRAD
ncbi:MAG: DUF2147 domain-containing protein [Proteobacteria bacterium]|nr:DUF2147 domain-containing protein [Pseudomonadota bacterium]